MSQSSMVNSSGVASESDSYGVVTEPRTLRLERVLPGPIERVWAYLTESEKRGKWLAFGDMETREGGQVKLVFHSTKLSAYDGPTPERFKKHEGSGFEARILRYEPPRLLSYTWGGKADSEVSFELTPQGNDVLLVLTHSLLPNRQTMMSVSSGWHAHLGILSALLEGREPGPFWSEIERLEAEYEQRIPAE
jgi:uncharacterized protein YndB with AHSA1/START domain